MEKMNYCFKEKLLKGGEKRKMNKSLVLLFLLAFLSINIVSAGVVYQENSDSVSSIGNWFDAVNTYDGDWETYSSGSYDAYGTYIYLNYSKPEGALISSSWEVKDHESQENLTIDTYCFSQDILQLRIQRITSVGESYIRWSCYDGSSWESLRTSSMVTGYDDALVYEEAVWWDIEELGEECDYYVGDEDISLPQIISSKIYDDGPTHKMYLACLYDLDGESGYDGMIDTSNCQKEIEYFSPDSEGEHSYNLLIAYREREWNSENHQWETIDEGTDGSLEYNFRVCDIPDDEEGHDSFVIWVQDLLCNWFGWFC